MFNLRTGVDLVEISRIAELKPSIRERFLKRIYTEYELSEAKNSDASLAGKFAAKEAVAKALGCGIGAVSWQEIEIRHGENHEPVLTLYGKARKLADSLHLALWSVSISHTHIHAVAVVVAIGMESELL